MDKHMDKPQMGGELEQVEKPLRGGFAATEEMEAVGAATNSTPLNHVRSCIGSRSQVTFPELHLAVKRGQNSLSIPNTLIPCANTYISDT